jgi:phosphatidylserine/phosphatidylglycerophosphate/cardiolipin synthase-like enzyme
MGEAVPGTRGTFQARVIEAARLPGGATSFHPKSWRFEGPGLAVAFVGSSNVSLAALQGGIEWNLRIDRDRDAAGWQQIVDGFEALWGLGLPLTADWISRYAERARRDPSPPLPGAVRVPGQAGAPGRCPATAGPG